MVTWRISDRREWSTQIASIWRNTLVALTMSARIEDLAEFEPIFDHFGLETQIDANLGRKVWLKSGGYLIIDQSEALTAIDVNTGRYVGRANLEETVLRTNLEAVAEVVQQLRFRNIGGLIIIDTGDSIGDR